MQIGVSGLFVQPSRVGGAEFMLRNLLQGFADIKQPSDEISLYVTEDWKDEPPAGIRRVELRQPAFTNRFMQESALLPFYTRSLDALLFPNYFMPPISTAARVIVVIHDVQYRHLPQHFSAKKRAWLRLSHALALRRADHIVAISDYTRHELIRAHGEWAASKISVIHNPIDWDRFHATLTQEEHGSIPPGEFVLAVAAHYPHKNLTTLIRAFQQVRQRRPDLHLVIAGQVAEHLRMTAPAEAVHQLVEELGLGGSVHITGHVSDALMGELYRRAQLFVFPSLYEGFGMPPVEALGMRVPVLTTRCAAIPEVTRGLAKFVDDPLDSGEFAARILEMLQSPGRYAANAQEAETIRSEYDPRKAAQEYFQVLSGATQRYRGEVGTPVAERI